MEIENMLEIGDIAKLTYSFGHSTSHCLLILVGSQSGTPSVRDQKLVTAANNKLVNDVLETLSLLKSFPSMILSNYEEAPR